jgi:hypothetical protein
MERRPILEKPKGLTLFIILLIIAGFVASVILFGDGAISEIIHP